jgi:hypothetical protein
MTHSLFLSVRERFVILLEPINNSYKYARYYRLQINKYIIEDEENELLNYIELSNARILQQSLYMMMVIYTEIGKCRYHSNDAVAKILEKDINADIVKILKEDKYKNQKIVEINQIITSEIDEIYFVAYEKQYGYRPSVNSGEIIEITNENVEDIYTNFQCVKRILNLNDKYKEIEDYLFCLYYFNKTQ